MRTRILSAILALILLSAGGWLYWHRSSADVIAPDEAVQPFETPETLRGPTENAAALEDAVITDDGTIQLAPLPVSSE